MKLFLTFINSRYILKTEESSTMSDQIQGQDCAVCLQKCNYPTQLPCGHVFCFLCVKGVAIQNRRCAMCRADIPPDYLDHPILLENVSPQQVNADTDVVEYQWYYEGRNGWWKYDERSNIELETAFNDRGGECTLLLAGALYCIDFENMTQVKCNDRTRRRRVKRDTPLFPAKGIAGIKTENSNVQETKREDESNANNQNQAEAVTNVMSIDDDSDDSDVQIITVEPEIIQIDDMSDELERLSLFGPEPASHNS